MKVYISPTPAQAKDNNGIGRVIHAQYRYLPEFGIELVSDPEQADVIAGHITRGNLPRIDVLHSHGLYWTGDPGSGEYSTWHHQANDFILESARSALEITVPSDWVAEPYRRDMHIQPAVIPHGIELDEWNRTGDPGAYLLWNKNRDTDVCDPTPAWALAERGLPVVSTFGLKDRPDPPTLQVTGTVEHAQMKDMVKQAGMYLSTTKETFGVGILEALAAGVPVLGYAHGGILDIVRHEREGYLVQPGDIDGLAAGYDYIWANWVRLSEAARKRAEAFTWQTAMLKYAHVYQRAYEARQAETNQVAVIITNYNYAPYVREAVDSALAQKSPADEIIVVDDGSTDNSREVLEGQYLTDPRVRLIFQENQGVAAARNNGIAAAKSPLITCLDADDQLAPEFVGVLRSALAADRGLGIAYTGLVAEYNGKRMRSDFPPPFEYEILTRVSNPPSNCIPSACMFRRAMWERAGGYKQVYAPGEDTEFWLRALSLGYRAKRVTSEPFFIYRIHDNSASKRLTYKQIDAWHPYMRDRQYPMAAPAKAQPLVRSYSDPAVTIVIPVGPGHESNLIGALDSIAGQSCRSWKVIAVNDTGQIGALNFIQAAYPYVEIWQNAKRLGAGQARNAGLDAVRSPLVLWLDADDYLAPEALGKMLTAYAGAGGRYIYTDWIAVAGDQAEVHQTPEYNPLAWFDTGQHAVTVLMATEDARKVGGFDGEMSGWEDWDFFVKCAIYGVHGQRLAEPLFYYRMDTGARRAISLERGRELLELLRGRYKEVYKNGGNAMARCCGGNGAAILAAKRAAMRSAGEAVPVQTISGGNNSMDTIRLEYVGENRGAISFRVHGRNYRGGNNPINRYVNAHPEDVEDLLLLGRWRRVDPPAAPPPPIAPKVKPAPVDPGEALLKAKAEMAEAEAKALEAESWEAEPAKEIPMEEPEPLAPPNPVGIPPEMPKTVKDLKAAIEAGVGREVLFAWLEEENGRGDNARPTAVEILTNALDAFPD